jgi:hypothetical protein
MFGLKDYSIIENNFKIIIPELIALKFNLKKNIRFFLDENRYDLLHKLSIRNNFLIKRSKFKLILNNDSSISIARDNDSNSKYYHVYIAKERSILYRLEKLCTEEEDYYKIGKLLSYPKCCINFYKKIMFVAKNHPDFIRQTFKNTKGKMSFYLNNLFINFYFKDNFWYLISHFPCSYNCSKIINYAKNLLNIIKKYNKSMGDEIVNKLKSTFYYVNINEFKIINAIKLDLYKNKKQGIILDFSK